MISAIGGQLDAFFSLGRLGSLSDAPSPEDETLLSEVEAVMASSGYGSKFSRVIEDRFKQSTAEPRGKLFIRVAIVGTLIYDLFLLIDMFVVPDVMWLAVPLQLCVVTPITLILIAAIWRFGIDPELPTLVVLTAMLASTLILFMMSRSPHVDLFACVFGLFLISANVSLAIGFGSAILFTTLALVSTSTAIILHPSLDTADRVFSIAILVAVANYSLGGNYRIDAGVRTAYLFALREGLRARLLDVSNQKLRTLVAIDGLTGVGNRRFLDEHLDTRWREPSGDEQLALLLIDIDHFKTFNDEHGHQTGDTCLRYVAQALAREMRPDTMILARYGGEEFAVVIDDAAKISSAFAEHLRRTVERLSIETEDGKTLRITVSIGCATLAPSPFTTPADLLRAADAALYQAKRAGRNRVSLAELASSDLPAGRADPVAKAGGKALKKAS